MVISCLRWVDHLKCTFVWLFSSMDEKAGFHISCFEWTLGEFGQPKKLIPEGQGILAFAYLSIKNKMAAGSDFYCCGPLIFARQKLVCYCGMFGHVLFEVRGITTWVTASYTLEWFFSSVNVEVRFQISYLTYHTLYSNETSLHCGWADVCWDLILWLRSARTICIDLAFVRNVFSCVF